MQMQPQHSLYRNRYFLLIASFIGSGIIVTVLAFAIQTALYGSNQVIYLGLIRSFLIGSFAGLVTVYVLLRIKARSQGMAEALLNAMEETATGVVIEAGKMLADESDVDVETAIQAALRLIRPRAEQGGVTLKVNLNDLHPVFRGDVTRFKQILVNLLSNAVKFTNDGGDVSVEVNLEQSGSINLSINDTGVGMSKDDLILAMEKFGQVRSKNGIEKEGTGLGLPLTKGLVEAQGSKMNIESVVGQGTTVTVSIPSERVIH